MTMNAAPILIIDDDTDDKDFLQEAWKDLPFDNPLIFFSSAEDALNYLNNEKIVPFLILSDVNLQATDGFAFKEKLLEDERLNYASIPFVFWSSAASPNQIKRSYDLGGNGFFIKGNNLSEIKQSLVDIVNYWTKSKTPIL
jgi:CheY-like chemotaxis protein